MFTMGYDGLPCNLPWMEPEITICVQATTAAATNLHPPAWSKKKSCGQMWPPETGWNWIQRNESGTVVFINDIQDDTKYIKIRY